MMIVDSNLIIYAASGNYPDLLEWFLDNRPSASAISMVEALGYHKLKAGEKAALETIFSELVVIYPTPEIFHTAIELRQQHTMSLGDALIAGTALHHQLMLATHNTRDFNWIDSLKITDPVEDKT